MCEFDFPYFTKITYLKANTRQSRAPFTPPKGLEVIYHFQIFKGKGKSIKKMENTDFWVDTKKEVLRKAHKQLSRAIDFKDETDGV